MDYRQTLLNMSPETRDFANHWRGKRNRTVLLTIRVTPEERDALRAAELAELVTVFEDHHTSPERPGKTTAVLAPSDPRLDERSPAIVERLVIAELDQRTRGRGPGPEPTR